MLHGMQQLMPPAAPQPRPDPTSQFSAQLQALHDRLARAGGGGGVSATPLNNAADVAAGAARTNQQTPFSRSDMTRFLGAMRGTAVNKKDALRAKILELGHTPPIDPDTITALAAYLGTLVTA
jgi:hypothetical protein